MMFLSEWLSCRVLETPRTGCVFPRGSPGRVDGARELLAGTADGEPEAATRPRDELVGDAGRAVGLGDDHDLVGVERGQSVGDRLQRIGVADLPLHAHSGLLQPVDPGGDAFLRLRRAASSSDSQRRSREFSAGATTRTSAFATWTGVTRSRAMMSTFMIGFLPDWLLVPLKTPGTRAYSRRGSRPRRGNISAAKESLEV